MVLRRLTKPLLGVWLCLALILAGFPAVLGDPTAAQAQADELSVPVSPVGDSGIAGVVYLTDNFDGTLLVEVIVDGVTGDHPMSLHAGSCGDPGVTIFPLSDVSAFGESLTEIPLTLNEIIANSPYAIVLYRSEDEQDTAVACAAIGEGGDPPAAASVDVVEIPAGAEEVTITGTVDGVTFTADRGGEALTVRLAGGILPEGDACLLGRANARLAQLLEPGQPVYLQTGSLEFDVDGALLRYTWIIRNGQPTLLNAKMIRDGYVDLDPDQVEADPYFDAMEGALTRAQTQESGIWGDVCE